MLSVRDLSACCKLKGFCALLFVRDLRHVCLAQPEWRLALMWLALRLQEN